MFTMSLASNDEAAGSSSHTATTVALLQTRVDDLSGQLSAVQHMVEDGLTEKEYVVEASKDRILKEIHVLLSQSKQDMQVSVQDCRVSLQQELRDFVQQQEQQHLKEFRDEIDSLREQTRLTDASLMDKAPAPNDNPDKLKDVMATIERIVQEQEYLRKLQESTNVEAMRAEIQSILADMGVPSSSEKYGNMVYASKEPNIDKHDALVKEGEQHDDFVKEHRHDNIVNAQMEEPGESFKEDDNLKDPMNTQEVVDKIHTMQDKEEPFSMEDFQPLGLQTRDPGNTASVGHFLVFQYNWQGSIWDVSMFIGTELLGIQSSLSTVMCLVLYLVLCAALVWESGHAMSQRSFDTGTQSEFWYWRSAVAHDLGMRIPVTGESLASSVCHNRLYVPYANLQQDAAGVLSEYLQGHPVFGTYVKRGVVMCCLVISVWLLKIIEELDTIWDFLLACMHLPISKRVQFRADSMDPSFSELVSISRARMNIVMLLVTARILLALFVFWFGLLFLIQETSLTDMVLNAMALEMMLDLDELIFAAFLPMKPSLLVEHIQPVTYTLRKGESWKVWIKLANVLTVMVSGVLIKMLVLDPFVVVLQNNLDALCGAVDDSSLDFVMKVDSIGVPWAVATPSSRSMAETYAQHAVSEVIKVGFPKQTAHLTSNQRANLGLFMQVQSALELSNLVISQDEFKDPHSWTIFNPLEMTSVLGWSEAHVLGGTDFGDAPGTVYNRYLQFLLGASGKISCDDVPLHKCYQYGHDGLVMRKLCPNWCGCNLPTGGTISNAVVDDAINLMFPGCTAWAIRTQRFRETLRDLPCVDTIRSDVFIPWVQGFGDYRVPQASTLLADQLLSSFESGGCQAVARVNLGIEGARICAESSLPAVCPVSCGCDENVNWTNSHAWRMDYCPQDCGRLQSFICFTVFVNHTVDTGSFGPKVGFPCVFPFKYRDKTYNKCTTDDWVVPWCAVTLQNGLLNQWGDCPPGC